ncbi:MAG: ATP-binding cassette domain-containing protein, partial [Chitinophagaceae bacterium]|nr:ATP-binding cassette domain-containing protein [Chitinophagaceae bacterium]
LEELARSVMSFKFSLNYSLHLRKTDHFVTGYLHSRTAHFKVLLVQYWTLIGFKTLITAAMLIVGVALLVDQQINIGQFIAAEIVILTIISSVEKLIVNLDSVYDVITSTEKLGTLTNKPREENGTLSLSENNTGLALQARNLTFGYGQDEQILKNLTFDIKSGEKICVVGPYASGKSTLLKVLSGSYGPFTGELNINGMPITLYDKNSIRRKTGVMLHQEDIFQGTLWENITMGNEEISFEDVIAFSDASGLQLLPLNNKEMLLAPLQIAGQHLSDRFARKVILLRALIKRPGLLLLEEPWLGFEENDAAQVKDYLLHKTRGITTIVITTDTSFARECDKVLLLDHGMVKAYGSWDEIQNVI